jgi:ribonuclease D
MIGFDFKSDLEEISKFYPHMTFYDNIPMLVDLQSLYSLGKDQKNKNSLDAICEIYLSAKLCKAERMSNWERRPLRQS